MKRSLAFVASAAALLCVAGCGGGAGSASNSTAPSGTSSDLPSLPNIESSGGIGNQPVPTLAGYQQVGSWTFNLNANQGQFTPGTGPEDVAWPASQGGCAVQWYLIRWHAASAQTQVVAAYGVPGAAINKMPPATKGWLSLDGCEVPQWELATSSASGDIVVDASLYQPPS